jgi:hypothetical protein
LFDPAADAWIAVAISYTGLSALGVPEQSLQSFPEAFRVGMAERAEILLDHGDNDPKNWHQPFGSGQIHIVIRSRGIWTNLFGGSKKIAKKIAKNKRCYANTLRPAQGCC